MESQCLIVVTLAQLSAASDMTMFQGIAERVIKKLWWWRLTRPQVVCRVHLPTGGQNCGEERLEQWRGLCWSFERSSCFASRRKNQV